MAGQRIDNAANLQVKESLSYKTATTTAANGTAVDTKGWKSITGHLDTGTITDGTHTITLEESDVVGSGYTAIAAASYDLYGDKTDLVVVAADDDKDVYVNVRSTKRYVRAVNAITGETTGGIFDFDFILTEPDDRPAN